jgi:hypothetical protein
LCRSVAAFHSESKRDAYLPPILDRNADYSEPEVSGLVKFEELCKKELAHHDYVRLPLSCLLVKLTSEHRSFSLILHSFSKLIVLPPGRLEGSLVCSQASHRNQLDREGQNGCGRIQDRCRFGQR